MKIVGMAKLAKFSEKHPNSSPSLNSWRKRVELADFQNFVQLRETFPFADLVGSLIVVNISDNNFRLIARINYKTQEVFIRAVLTHAEYIQR